FADGRRIAFDVEQVVRDLERLAKRGTVTLKRGPLTSVGLAQDRPGHASEAQERSGFHRLQDLDVLLAELGRRSIEPSFGREVDHLPAPPPAEAGSARERRDELEPDAGVRMRLATRKNVEGESEKAVAGKNGTRLVKCLVRGRTAAPQVVIVHGGKVVVS